MHTAKMRRGICGTRCDSEDVFGCGHRDRHSLRRRILTHCLLSQKMGERRRPCEVLCALGNHIYINIMLYIAHKSKRKEEFYGGKNVYEMRKANTLEQGKQVGMFQLWLHRKPSV